MRRKTATITQAASAATLAFLLRRERRRHAATRKVLESTITELAQMYATNPGHPGDRTAGGFRNTPQNDIQNHRNTNGSHT